jgi:glutamyl-tRNA reductase
MYLLVAGFRYKNAPVRVREQFSINTENMPLALQSFIRYPSIRETIILSTCNRTEFYMLVDDTEVASGSIVRFLADYHNLEVSEIRKYMFTLMHDDTIRQIFKVTSGIDSMVVGETEITYQVKEAFNIAHKAQTTGPILDKLFNAALATNKKVRTLTNITSIVDNVSSAAIELAKNSTGDLKNKKIAVVGAGKMATLALKHLVAKYNHRDIIVLNRSEKPLEYIYDRYKFPVASFRKLKETLATIDILFVATAAPHVIIKPEQIPQNKKLTIIDISVPRNVDNSVGNMPGITLYNTDDIHKFLHDQADTRNEMISQAEKIIKEEAENFSQWLIQRDIVPTMVKLRDKIEMLRQEKIDKMRSKVCPFSEQKCMLMEELSRQLVNTILHDPTVRIKSTREHQEIYQTARLLNDLFNLDKNDN